MRKNYRTCVLITLSTLNGLLVTGCQEVSRHTPLNGRIEESQGRTTLHLSTSPNDIVGVVSSEAIVLTPDLIIDGLEEEIGQLEDVRLLRDGRIAVLDGMRKQVLLFGADGSPAGEWGREGNGPGDLADPLSLAALGDGVVVLQQAGEIFLTYFGPDGVRVRANPPVEGDWGRNRYRGYTFDTWGRQDGPLDSDRNFGSLGDSLVVLLSQVNEERSRGSGGSPGLESPPGALLTFDTDLTHLDTLADLTGTTVRAGHFGAPWATFYVPTYAPSPLWAGGDGWLALGSGRESQVTVYRFGMSDTLYIDWPDSLREIEDKDLDATARWLLSIQATNSPESEATLDRLSRSERRRMIPWTIQNNLRDPVEQAPHVMALFGGGRCLFLAGFDPEAWQTAVAHRVIAIDIVTPRVLGVLELPLRDAFHPQLATRGISIRDVDKESILAAYRNDLGVPILERYPIPFDC